jgi:hypothetical protein
MANKKKKKKVPTTYVQRKVVSDAEPKPRPKPKPKTPPLEMFTVIGKRITVKKWSAELEKLVAAGFIKKVKQPGGIVAWLTKKGAAELAKKR